ncbi:hypothetical protein FOYG_17159 [Fusarium oxysporum NRRL 32931]|uniref:Uncharacterized protein n=1 Tax=Fusarium oxysporum NRRL 32931 TaxID=660029 RepID=W9HAU5_FUSOX|nr:hypothetical protein FOYG_17159 [Fusarium oxysporum NRRL 32931]
MPNLWYSRPSALSSKKPHNNSPPDRIDASLNSLPTASSTPGNESSPVPDLPSPSLPTAAASPPTDRGRLTHRQQQHGLRQTDPPHRQGQPRTIAPPRQDLRVFIRLEAGAPARAHSSYATRTLIQEKVGAVSDKIRQVFQVRSGWAVLTTDSETRDFLVEKQAEWAAETDTCNCGQEEETVDHLLFRCPRWDEQ